MNNNKELRAHFGKIVSSENEENWWRPELFEKHTRAQIPAVIEIVSPPPNKGHNYNCFVYIFGLQDNEDFLGNENLDFTSKLDVLFDEMIEKNILKSVKASVPGSMILYRADNGKISHVGLLEDTQNVISKWSWGPLLRHKIFDVPDHYGNIIEFYEVNEEVKKFVLERRKIAK